MRVASHDGEARRVLEHRLSVLIEAYTDDLEKAASKIAPTRSTTALDLPARGALGELVDHIASQAAARGDPLAAIDTAASPSSFPQLDVLAEFKKIWSKARTENQVRQALEQIPTNAGPLNSGNLVHRSLTLMRELSPGYLEQFLSYVDALSWIEHMNQSRGLAAKDAPQAQSTKKPARRKPRERHE